MSDTDMILTRARFQELEQRLAKAEADKDELLDALKQIVETAPFVNPNDSPFNKALSAAFVAIAKAEGLS